MILNYIQGLVESSLVLCFFYFGYFLLLRKEASFKQNRIYLVVGVIASLFVPFLQFSAPQGMPILRLVELKTINVSAYGNQFQTEGHSFTFYDLLSTIYLLGLLFFIVRFVYQLVKISGYYKNSSIQINKSSKLVFTGKRHSVFSFLNMVFVDKESENCSNLDIILNHEHVHVAQKHSIDLLLFELLAIVQWFNPVVWLYRKTIKQNHEFLADKGALSKGLSLDKYQGLLLQNYSSLTLGMANSFNHSLTFKRLIMMKKNNSSKKSIAKLAVLLPLLLVSVYFISCSKEEQVAEETKTDKQEIVKEKSANATEEVTVIGYKKEIIDTVCNIVEVMPEFPGGSLGLRKFIATNVKYPSEAREAGIEGKVYVNFVVSKTGEVANVQIAQGVDPLLDAEAVRVVSTVPEWKPGEKDGEKVNVQYTVPINFELQ